MRNNKPIAPDMDEQEVFQKLQDRFPRSFKKLFPDKQSRKTVVILPSLTLDQHLLSKIQGHIFYEERLLSLLMLLRQPNTQIIYITSVPIDPIIIDYYLQYLPGITREHALRRLTLISCYDDSSLSLTEKVLNRPLIIKRIKDSIAKNSNAHLTCFNVTCHERKLACMLQMPIYGCNPALESLGHKSSCKQIFKSCGLKTPFGFENIYSADELIMALSELKAQKPSLQKAVVKLNEGFSGEGNAIFSYDDLEVNTDLGDRIRNELSRRLWPVADDLSPHVFINDLVKMGGIVEEFIMGEIKISPSVQCRINPLGECKVISTHDQIVGGMSDQVYLGAIFPANKDYAIEIADDTLKVADYLRDKGVIGRFGIDFISVKEEHGWENYAIEINLRKGGTTHPFILLQLLTDGDYDHKSAEYLTANNLRRYYLCTDNLMDESFKGLTPPDLIDIAIASNVQYNSSTQEGVMFHLISALSKYGKLGVVCVGASPERAKMFYDNTIAVLKNPH